MRAISMTGNEKRAGAWQSRLGRITFSLNWSDARAMHEERLHVDKFGVWREADFLPADIAAKIRGMRPGDHAQAALSAGELSGVLDAAHTFFCRSHSAVERTARV